MAVCREQMPLSHTSCLRVATVVLCRHIMGDPGPATQNVKGGRIIVLQNTNLPLTTDFSLEK